MAPSCRFGLHETECIGLHRADHVAASTSGVDPNTGRPAQGFELRVVDR